MTDKELETKINELEEEIFKLKKELKSKITLEEFFESKRAMLIHCDTEEKANILLEAFHKMGKKWCDKDSYINKNHFDEYEENTGYTNNRGYTSCHNALFVTYEFENVDLTIPLKYQFSEDEKTILRNIDKKYKYIARGKYNYLHLYESKPYKEEDKRWDCVSRIRSLEFTAFNHIFKAIKWEDDEPVEISKIIGDK